MTISKETLEALSTAPTVDTRLGQLRFPDGVADAETAQRIYDSLDFTRGVEALLNGFQDASMVAIRIA